MITAAGSESCSAGRALAGVTPTDDDDRETGLGSAISAEQPTAILETRSAFGQGCPRQRIPQERVERRMLGC